MPLTSKQKAVAAGVVVVVGVLAVILVMVLGGDSDSENKSNKKKKANTNESNEVSSSSDEEGGSNAELCEGGLMDVCARNVGSGSYLSSSCGRRFVKDEGSSTGYIQCVWSGAPRNSCDMWTGEDIRSATECEAPQTNGKPTCAHGGKDGNGGSWQQSTPTPSNGDQCSSTCCCPSGSTIQVTGGNKWRCT